MSAMQFLQLALCFLLPAIVTVFFLQRRRRVRKHEDRSKPQVDLYEDERTDGQPFPGIVFDPSWVQKSPVDEPHPNKWVPPDVDGAQAIPLGREQDAKEWLSMEMHPFQNMFDHHSRREPAKVAVTWVGLNGDVQRELTYADLQAQSCAIAVWLREKRGLKEGDRVMLVYPPGLDFLVAFLGCLRAGVVAVPVYPPNPLKLSLDVPKFARITSDSAAAMVLSSRDYFYAIVLPTWTAGTVSWPSPAWHTTDHFRTIKVAPSTSAIDRLIVDTEVRLFGAVQQRTSESDRLLFLQYTSGSTSDPKGVMIGDKCLAHNNTFVRKTLRISTKSRFFSWLPQYHDMGLICAYLTTLSAGGQGYFTSPLHFLQRPALWLQMMSKYRATHTATPNFALDLTIRKFVPERDALDGLDLSALECVVNGAEPVQVSSIERWINRLRPYGFAPCAMCPAYGLAEHTVGTGAWGCSTLAIPPPSDQPHAAPRVLHASGNMVACDDGRGFWRIVDPYTLKEVGENCEGELWIHADSVAQGYWNNPELTQKVFRARIKECQPGKPDVTHVDFLRTGDLAVVLHGQGFITGRVKDLVIIGGRNFYPQDIERTVEEACDAVRPGCVAAFTWSEGGGEWMGGRMEQVGIVAEVVQWDGPKRRSGGWWGWMGSQQGEGEGKAQGHTSEESWLAEVTVAIRTAVNDSHRVNPAVVVLIPPRTIPKTTSGKIRRRATRQSLKDGSLSVLNPSVCGLSLTQNPTGSADGPPASLSPSPSHSHPMAVRHDDLPPDAPLDAVVLHLLGVPAGTSVSNHTPLLSLGLTSMAAIEVSEALESRAGASVPVEQLLGFTVGDVRRIRVDTRAVREAAEARRRMGELPDLGLGTIAAGHGKERQRRVGRGRGKSSGGRESGEGKDGGNEVNRLGEAAGQGVRADSRVAASVSDSSSSGNSSASASVGDSAVSDCGDIISDDSSSSDVCESDYECESDVSGEAAGYVMSIGTATPSQAISQWQFSREYLTRVGNKDPVLQDKLTRMCAVSGIHTRYAAMTESDLSSHPDLTRPGAPSLSTRNALFSREALPLGLQAAQRALRQWGGASSGITHLLVSSMTSMHMPGLDLQLAKALSLPRCVHRTLLQMTGCHAGVQMMRMAMDICQASKNRGSSGGGSGSGSGGVVSGACVLLVAVEVPSISLQAPSEDNPSLGNLVSAAIFGDGAAAMVVSSTATSTATTTSRSTSTSTSISTSRSTSDDTAVTEARPGHGADREGEGERQPPVLFELHRAASVFVEETEGLIRSEVTHAGFEAGLERELPRVIGPPVTAFASQLLSVVGLSVGGGQAEVEAEGEAGREAFWALHPGGRAIVDAVERHCKLPPHALAASREVLRKFGNVSSATVLFVLEELLKRKQESPSAVPEWGLAIGIGPGVTMEGVLMRLPQSTRTGTPAP